MVRAKKNKERFLSSAFAHFCVEIASDPVVTERRIPAQPPPDEVPRPCSVSYDQTILPSISTLKFKTAC